MLVHGYRQVLRLARLPIRPSLARFAQTTREKGTRLLDQVTTRTQKGIEVTETAVGHAIEVAPRPSRDVLETAFERVVRVAPRLAGRSVEVALMAATAVAAVVLAFVVINGIRTTSSHLIDSVSDAASSALTQLDLEKP